MQILRLLSDRALGVLPTHLPYVFSDRALTPSGYRMSAPCRVIHGLPDAGSIQVVSALEAVAVINDSADPGYRRSRETVSFIGDTRGLVRVVRSDQSGELMHCIRTLGSECPRGSVTGIAANGMSPCYVAVSYLGCRGSVGGVSVYSPGGMSWLSSDAAPPAQSHAFGGEPHSVAWLDASRLCVGGSSGSKNTGIRRILPSGVLHSELLADIGTDAFCVSGLPSLQHGMIVGTRSGGVFQLDARAPPKHNLARTPALIQMRESVVALIPLAPPFVMVGDAATSLELHDMRAPSHPVAQCPGYSNNWKRLGVAVHAADGPGTMIAAASCDGVVRFWDHHCRLRGSIHAALPTQSQLDTQSAPSIVDKVTRIAAIRAHGEDGTASGTTVGTPILPHFVAATIGAKIVTIA